MRAILIGLMMLTGCAEDAASRAMWASLARGNDEPVTCYTRTNEFGQAVTVCGDTTCRTMANGYGQARTVCQ